MGRKVPFFFLKFIFSGRFDLPQKSMPGALEILDAHKVDECMFLLALRHVQKLANTLKMERGDYFAERA